MDTRLLLPQPRGFGRASQRGSRQAQVSRRAAAIAMGLACVLTAAAAPLWSQQIADEAPANRLAYLDEFCNPYYADHRAPRLTTPQWVGQPGVEAVVTLGIDDMRDPAKYEAFLRPLLDRLKRIDGRAPVSIMTNQIDPADPQLQSWLAEGLSLETHTADHPCPCLQGGDFAAAKSTYDRCVDQLFSVPGNRPVAFRFPCMDSLNTPSPRAYAEILNRTTPNGNFLRISTSVTCVFTDADPELPRELVIDEQGRQRFEKYLPFPSFVNRVDNYPYPFVIGRLCWEFPCAVPDDWQGFNLQQPNNPQTVNDEKAMIDAVVLKRGIANIIFHPHGWIRNTQLVEIVDHVVDRYGPRVQFLTFRECADRLKQHLLGGESLRSDDGGDNGVRLLDVNADGLMDVVIANARTRTTRIWDPQSGSWTETEFPVAIAPGASANGAAPSTGAGGPGRVRGSERWDVRFGVLRPSGHASCVALSPRSIGVWHFDSENSRWVEDQRMRQGIELEEDVRRAVAAGRDVGLRLRDLDLDGVCELLLLGPRQRAVWKWDDAAGTWRTQPAWLPPDVVAVDEAGADAGLRWVDLNDDRHADLVQADATRYSVDLFDATQGIGWRRVREGRQLTADSVPPIVRADGNNGVWFARGYLWVQNEDTHRLPDGVDRRLFAQLLGAEAK